MEPAAAARASDRYGARHLLPRLLAPLAAVAVAAIGLRVPGSWPATDRVAFGLAIAWALAGIAGPVPGRTSGQPARRPLGLGLLAALGGLIAATALTAARIAAQDGSADQHQTARAVATLAAPLVIAVSFHFLLALPDGRLVRSGRRILAVLGYVSALGTGAGLAVAHQPFTVLAGATTILDQTFSSIAAADSFFDDQVINLGSSYGPGVDLTFTYTLAADGPGGYGLDFVVGGAVPEPSTWAMTLVGFAGLGFAGYRARKREMQGAAASVRLDPEVGAPAEFGDRPWGRDLAAGVGDIEQTRLATV